MNSGITLLLNHVRCWQPPATAVIQSTPRKWGKDMTKQNLSRISRGWINDLCEPHWSLHFPLIYCQGLPLSAFVTKLISVINLTPLSLSLSLSLSLFTNSEVSKLTLCRINNHFTHAEKCGTHTHTHTHSKKKHQIRYNLTKELSDPGWWVEDSTVSTRAAAALSLARLMVDTGR